VTHLSFGPSSRSWRTECWSLGPSRLTGSGPVFEFLPRLSAISWMAHLLKYSNPSMYGKKTRDFFPFCLYIS